MSPPSIILEYFATEASSFYFVLTILSLIVLLYVSVLDELLAFLILLRIVIGCTFTDIIGLTRFCGCHTHIRYIMSTIELTNSMNATITSDSFDNVD